MCSVIKKYLILSFMAFISLSITGQRQGMRGSPWEDEAFFSAGYSLGLNTMSFLINTADLTAPADTLRPAMGSLLPGVNIHLSLNFMLNQFFDVRVLPGLSFGQRNVRYTGKGDNDTLVSVQKIESSFFELPIQLRYGWRMQNIKPYIIGGINYRYDYYAQNKYRIERPVYLRLNKPDLYYEAGAGIGFYLRGLKMAAEVKLSNGLRDVLAHDPHPGYPGYSNAIERLRSRMWVFTLHFE